MAPASQILHGAHVLADLDVVISRLSETGGIASVTANIPNYLNRPAGLNGATDILGHGLIEIYINPKLETYTQYKAHLAEALK